MYKMVPLSDFVSLSQGLAINKGTAHLVSEEKKSGFSYPLLRIADMMDNSFSKYISDEVNPSVIARKDDIIYTRTGQIGLAFRGFCGCVHNNSFIVHLVNNAITKDYLFVVLNSDFVRNQALSLAKNSVQPDLTHDMFKSIVIPVPELEEQEVIVKSYFSITDKINLNNAICSDLESMAKLLYDYWFVQFDFPDENGKPYKSSGGKMVWNEELKREIPKGWEAKRIRDIAIEGKDKPYNGDSIETIDLSVMPSGNMMLSSINSSENFSTNLFEMKQGDILFGSIRPYLKKAGIAPCNGAVAGTLHSFRPKRPSDYNFLAITLCNERVFDYATNASQGTKMPVVTLDTLMNYPIAYNSEISAKYNRINIKDIFAHCVMENLSLSTLRELLLPMLMNGQVKVGGTTE